jgi:hypothetical protein
MMREGNEVIYAGRLFQMTTLSQTQNKHILIKHVVQVLMKQTQSTASEVSQEASGKLN